MDWFRLIMSYLPVILQAVVAVEQTIKGSPGEAKKQVVLDTIQGAATGQTELPAIPVHALSAMIDTTVASLNSSGVFSHTVK